MGCTPSQSESHGKLSTRQNSEAPIDKPSRPLKVEDQIPPVSFRASNPTKPEVNFAAVGDSNMMDVEMAGSQDVPVWEVQPLQLVREGKIGRGGAGNVIKATDPSTGRVVALKVCLCLFFNSSITPLGRRSRKSTYVKTIAE